MFHVINIVYFFLINIIVIFILNADPIIFNPWYFEPFLTLRIQDSGVEL